jgi:hypothetical protein
MLSKFPFTDGPDLIKQEHIASSAAYYSASVHPWYSGLVSRVFCVGVMLPKNINIDYEQCGSSTTILYHQVPREKYLRQDGHGQTQVSVADASIVEDPEDLHRALSFIA